MAIDVCGRSGGLASGWNMQSFRCEGMCSLSSGIGMELFDAHLGMVLTILNIYVPYLNQVPFWTTLLGKSFISNRKVILGGELNFSLGSAEVWGPRVVSDSLAPYFSRHDLMEIAHIHISPTWWNKRTGDNRVAKRLDIFLVTDCLLMECDLVRQWVACGGSLIISLFSLRFKVGIRNLPSQ